MRARAVVYLLGLTLLGAAALAYPAPRGLPGTFVTDTSTATDASMFEAVVTRLRAGRHYCDAMGEALRGGGYPAGSVFNWRTPLHLVSLAAVPWWASRALLTALLVALFAATMAVSRAAPLLAWAAGGLQIGLLVLESAPDAVYVSEIWTGVLVGLSVCAFALRQGIPAVALGVAALFVRELAAPYCVAAACLSLGRRQWRECGAWSAGAVAYAGYYGWHALQVSAHLLPSDLPPSTGWVTLGGLPFLQSAIHKLGWLALLPGQVDALALALLVAGIAHGGTPVHARAGSAAFVGFFLVAGQPFNDYWGWVAGPTWAVTCSHGIMAVRTAVHHVLGRDA
jgi:hypothetical protein